MASPVPLPAQQVTDAFFTLQRIDRTRASSLELLKKYKPALPTKDATPPSSSRPSVSSTATAAGSAPLDLNSPTAGAAASSFFAALPPHPLLAYLQHLHAHNWADLAAASLASAFLSYHASAILALVHNRALAHRAQALYNSSDCASLLHSLAALHSAFQHCERLRFSLLQSSAFGQQLQLSLIPPSPFPSTEHTQAVAACMQRCVADALSGQGETVDGWPYVLQQLLLLDSQRALELQRASATVLPPADLAKTLPSLQQLSTATDVPSLLSIHQLVGEQLKQTMVASVEHSHSLQSLTLDALRRQRLLLSTLLSPLLNLPLPSLPYSLTAASCLASLTSGPVETLNDYTLPLPASLSDTANILTRRGSLTSRRSSASMPAPSSSMPAAASAATALLCADSLFMLRLYPRLHARFSRWKERADTAAAKLLQVTTIDCEERVAWVGEAAALVTAMRSMVEENEELRRLKRCVWMRCCQATLMQQLVQHAQRLVLRAGRPDSGKLLPALVLHSDLLHTIEALAPLPPAGTAVTIALTPDAYVAMLREGVDQLHASVLERCGDWLRQQYVTLFGADSENYPLVARYFPHPLQLTTNASHLFEHVDGEPLAQPSPLLSLFLYWLLPLYAQSAQLHEDSRGLLVEVVDALFASLSAHFLSIRRRQRKGVMNGNAAMQLWHEMDYIHWRLNAQALTTSPAYTHLRAILHILTHPSLYRRSLTTAASAAKRASTNSVAPAPSGAHGYSGGASGGFALPGHRLADWREWLAWSSGKWRSEFKDGMNRRGSMAEVDAITLQQQSNKGGVFGCLS